ncbi:MAG: hypothetical protein IJ092_01885 [Atopobiaceae bacterium]|nr:hypothetical protein [Atopobiaceae bacterium]MBR1829385.1 hypothetical protein [Atopobiaceae bacterium]
METLEKVELVREKTNVSYEKAREVLEACDYDVLEAVIAIERESMAHTAEAVEEILFGEPAVEDAAEVVEPEMEEEPEAEPEVEAEPAAESEAEPKEEPAVEPEPESDSEYDRDAEKAARKAAAQAKREANKGKFTAACNAFAEQVKHVIDAGFKMTFIAERYGEQVLALPVLIVVIGLLVWGAALWLMIIGMFFGFRYRVEGASPMTVDVNAVMDKAADVADDIKRDL